MTTNPLTLHDRGDAHWTEVQCDGQTVGQFPTRELAEAYVAMRGEIERLTARFDFITHLQRQREWSGRTFGPGDRAKNVVDHIRKELAEIEADPTDLSEWIDVVILALDGAWRAGYSPEQILAQLVGKQAKNDARKWPDWRTMPADKAIEHERSEP